MESDVVFRILLPSMLLSYMFHRGYYTRRLENRRVQPDIRMGRNFSTLIAGGMGILAFLSSLAYVLRPEWIAWANLRLPAWLRWTGVLIFFCGFALLQWSQVALGRNWSDEPTLLKDQQLISSGPYRYIRHPIYAAIVLILGAPMFVSSNGVVGLPWLSMTIIGVHERVIFEEALMLKRFGEHYKDYTARTGRWIPRLSRKGIQ